MYGQPFDSRIYGIPSQDFGRNSATLRRTNNVSTARKFSAEYDKSIEITGIDMNLINKFRMILATLSTKREINTEDFENGPSLLAAGPT